MRQTRRQFLASGAALAPLALAPADNTTLFGSLEVPDNAITHSDGRISAVIQMRDDVDLEAEENALERWTSRESHRRILEDTIHEPSSTATVVINPEDAARPLTTTLNNLGWVERFEINRRLEYAEPLDTIEGSEAWESFNSRVEFFAGSSPSDTGVAFDDDMEVRTIQRARRVTGADSDDRPTGSDVTIAIVDTGVNDSAIFEDADGNSRILETSKDFTSSGNPDGIDAVEDGDGHGSWIASAYAASPDRSQYEGYLPEASILALKALDDDGTGQLSDIAQAIKYAADEGADVIQLSLGAPQFNRTLHDALEYAVDEGSIPVAAAGNDRQITRYPSNPASSQWAICCAATTAEEPDDAKVGYFSNHGPHNGVADDSGGLTSQDGWGTVDIAGPGTKVEVLQPRRRGSANANDLTGTSMVVAPGAAIAAYIDENGREDFEDIRDRLHDTAEPIPNASVEEVGAGMANLENFLAGDEPDDDQEDSMTDEAEARGDFYRGLSDLGGGTVTRFLV